MNLLNLLHIEGFTLQRVATTNGGEWSGACPFCGGRDRFRVWPEEDGGRFWCRGCGKSGDAIQWLRDFRGLSFQEACAELGRLPLPISKPPREHREVKKPESSSTWQYKAGVFLDRAKITLVNGGYFGRYVRDRGLRLETVEKAGLGWNSSDKLKPREEWGLEPLKSEEGNEKKLWLPGGLVIPLVKDGAVLRLRIRRP